MAYGKTYASGVISAIVMTIIMVVRRAMGMPANLEMMLGTTMGSPPSATAWGMGLVIHVRNLRP